MQQNIIDRSKHFDLPLISNSCFYVCVAVVVPHSPSLFLFLLEENNTFLLAEAWHIMHVNREIIFPFSYIVLRILWIFFSWLLLQEPRQKVKESVGSIKRKGIESDEDSPPRKAPTHRRMAVVFDSDEEWNSSQTWWE